MKNCLSPQKFANLLFVNVRIRDLETTALFDTGAGMTVIVRSILAELGTAAETEALRAGNNNGVVRPLQTAVVSNIRIGGVSLDEHEVLVTDDADFAFTDDNGAPFPARMLLGWDVMGVFRPGALPPGPPFGQIPRFPAPGRQARPRSLPRVRRPPL